MRNLDEAVRRHVVEEMAIDPELEGHEAKIAVQDGVVTLSGCVDRFSRRRAAELAAWRVLGVRNVVNMIDVRLPSAQRRRDEDLVSDAAKALSLDVRVPVSRFRITAINGWLTLEGSVDHHYQKMAAEEALVHLPGVIGVVNMIKVVGRTAPAELEGMIRAALKRSALVDATRIHVSVAGGQVTLRGQVFTFAERSEATRLAWSFPGVTEVQNFLAIAHAQVVRGM